MIRRRSSSGGDASRRAAVPSARSAGRAAHARGHCAPLGTSPVEGGVNFSGFSRSATGAELLPFDRGDGARPSRAFRLDPAHQRPYHDWHAFVPGLSAGQLQGHRGEGHELHSAGRHRCDDSFEAAF